VLGILAPSTKGTQNGGGKDECFVTGTMNLFFFITGHIGIKFGQKTSIDVLY